MLMWPPRVRHGLLLERTSERTSRNVKLQQQGRALGVPARGRAQQPIELPYN